MSVFFRKQQNQEYLGQKRGRTDAYLFKSAKCSCLPRSAAVSKSWRDDDLLNQDDKSLKMKIPTIQPSTRTKKKKVVLAPINPAL